MIGGWLPGEGRRTDRIGALLMGYYEDGALRYAGRVGTGFTERTLTELARRLAPLRRPTARSTTRPSCRATRCSSSPSWWPRSSSASGRPRG